MQVGNQLILDFEYDRSLIGLTKVRMTCRVKGSYEANTVRPEFVGKAWPIECAQRQQFAGKTFNETEHHIYYEAGNLLNIMLHPMLGTVGGLPLPKADTLVFNNGATTYDFSAYSIQIGQ